MHAPKYRMFQSKVLNVDYHLLQVFTGDILEKKGHESVKKFQKEFGEDRIFFKKIDVTSQDDVEGMITLAIQSWSKVSHI